MAEQGGLYLTARIDADSAYAAAQSAAARGKVERWFGCHCYTRDTQGTVTGWADHTPGTAPTADCPAHPDLPEVLHMLGFLPTRPGKPTPATARQGNKTGQGRWPGQDGH